MSSRNSYGSAARGVVSDYAQLNTIPALLSVVFVGAGLYQFGGIPDLTLVWLDYTLQTQHALIASLGVYVVAFMSSETKDFRHYEDWEKVLIFAGPAVMLAYEYVPQVANVINTDGHVGPIVAFFLTVAAWGVAVR